MQEERRREIVCLLLRRRIFDSRLFGLQHYAGKVFVFCGSLVKVLSNVLRSPQKIWADTLNTETPSPYHG